MTAFDAFVQLREACAAFRASVVVEAYRRWAPPRYRIAEPIGRMIVKGTEAGVLDVPLDRLYLDGGAWCMKATILRGPATFEAQGVSYEIRGPDERLVHVGHQRIEPTAYLISAVDTMTLTIRVESDEVRELVGAPPLVPGPRVDVRRGGYL